MNNLGVVIVYRDRRTLPRAMQWCDERGWAVESVVPHDRYLDAMKVLAEGRAQIIVAASKDALDPNRVPRVEIVDDEPAKPDGSSESPDGDSASQ